jgi:hypothetical protein
MSDSFNMLTVVLDHEIKDEGAERIIEAIGMVKGVLSVKGDVADPVEFMAEERALSKLRTKLHDVLWPKRRE